MQPNDDLHSCVVEVRRPQRLRRLRRRTRLLGCASISSIYSTLHRTVNLTSRILDSQVPPPCDSEPGYQKCGDSEECKPTNWWCDGDYDCENGADEADCPDCPASTPLMTLKTENNSKHSYLHGVYCDVHRSELLV